MAYLSATNFQIYSAGVDLSGIEGSELDVILNSASLMCDSETLGNWAYQVVVNESHDLTTGRSIAWETYAYNPPVRLITGVFISNSLNVPNSSFYSFPIPLGNQPGPPGLPVGTLPTNFGGIYLDRDRNIISINYTTLQFGLAAQVFPFSSFTHPQIFLSYSAGYDSGSVQGIVVNNGGSNYSANPIVTIANSPSGPELTAKATAVVTAGVITSINLTFAGEAYATIPSVTITDTTGSGATATALAMPDGYFVPVPSWLKESTRLIAAAMVSERNLAAQGLSGVQQVRQGQSEFRRTSESDIKGSMGFAIPSEVRNILRLHRRTSLA